MFKFIIRVFPQFEKTVIVYIYIFGRKFVKIGAFASTNTTTTTVRILRFYAAARKHFVHLRALCLCASVRYCNARLSILVSLISWLASSTSSSLSALDKRVLSLRFNNDNYYHVQWFSLFLLFWQLAASNKLAASAAAATAASNVKWLRRRELKANLFSLSDLVEHSQQETQQTNTKRRHFIFAYYLLIQLTVI